MDILDELKLLADHIDDANSGKPDALSKLLICAVGEIRKLREALQPFAAVDLLECRLPPEFAMHVLRARGALTHNPI